MSRIGKQPVEVPSGVDVKVQAGTITVKGPKGELNYTYNPAMTVKVEDGQVVVERPSDQKSDRALHGLTRSLISNMVEGVTEGFQKTLEIVGVGYRADMKGKSLTLNVGYSHPIQYTPMDGVTLECPDQTTVVVSGPDKQKVGQVAAEIRGFRPPEPYKGKGIRYKGEHIRRKAGKTATAGV